MTERRPAILLSASSKDCSRAEVEEVDWSRREVEEGESRRREEEEPEMGRLLLIRSPAISSSFGETKF